MCLEMVVRRIACTPTGWSRTVKAVYKQAGCVGQRWSVVVSGHHLTCQVYNTCLIGQWVMP